MPADTAGSSCRRRRPRPRPPHPWLGTPHPGAAFHAQSPHSSCQGPHHPPSASLVSETLALLQQQACSRFLPAAHGCCCCRRQVWSCQGVGHSDDAACWRLSVVGVPRVQHCQRASQTQGLQWPAQVSWVTCSMQHAGCCFTRSNTCDVSWPTLRNFHALRTLIRVHAAPWTADRWQLRLLAHKRGRHNRLHGGTRASREPEGST